MHAHCEPIRGWLVRVYVPQCSYEAGDPYENCVVAEEVEPGVVELKGLVKTPTREQYRAVQKVFEGYEVKTRRFERR